MVKQREADKEAVLKDILQQKGVTAYGIEAKAGGRSIPDQLCITKTGEIFLLEVKDGADYSPLQVYNLKRIKKAWSVDFKTGKPVYYCHKTNREVDLDYILSIVGE